MNTGLARKILGHVTAHRDQFDMSIWGDSDPQCGTTACLAGWAMLLSGYQIRDYDKFIRPDGTTVGFGEEGEEAAMLLDLSDAEQFGTSFEECTLFGEADEDAAIARFRALTEAAEGEDAVKAGEGKIDG